MVTKGPQIDRKVATKWSYTPQLVTKRPPLYLTVVTNWSQSGHQEVTKRPQIDRKVATKWPSTHQFVKRPPIYPEEVNEWLTIDPKLIPKWSICGQQTTIDVVWKQQAIPKWFQSLKWSTSAYKKVTKRPSWNLKVVPKWSQSSQQMIQKWSPSNHQITKQQPNGS